MTIELPKLQCIMFNWKAFFKFMTIHLNDSVIFVGEVLILGVSIVAVSLT